MYSAYSSVGIDSWRRSRIQFASLRRHLIKTIGNSTQFKPSIERIFMYFRCDRSISAENKFRVYLQVVSVHLGQDKSVVNLSSISRVKLTSAQVGDSIKVFFCYSLPAKAFGMVLSKVAQLKFLSLVQRCETNPPTVSY